MCCCRNPKPHTPSWLENSEGMPCKATPVWRPRPVSPAPHAQQQGRLPRSLSAYKYCSQTPAEGRGKVFEREEVLDEGRKQREAEIKKQKTKRKKKRGDFLKLKGEGSLKRGEVLWGCREERNREKEGKKKGSLKQRGRVQTHQHWRIVIFQLTIFFPRCSTIEEKAATCASARGRRRRRKQLLSSGFPATTTFLTTVRNRRLPLHHHQHIHEAAAEREEHRWQGNKGNQERKQHRKQQRRGSAAAATPPPNRSPAPLSAHLSKLIIPDNSSHYPLSLFIFLHAERVQYTFCKQEIN